METGVEQRLWLTRLVLRIRRLFVWDCLLLGQLTRRGLMSKRHIMRIELSGPAKNKLSALSDKHGMTQVAMMSRLVEWFANQDEMIQATTLGHFPEEIRSGVAQLILSRIASGKNA